MKTRLTGAVAQPVILDFIVLGCSLFFVGGAVRDEFKCFAQFFFGYGLLWLYTKIHLHRLLKL